MSNDNSKFIDVIHNDENQYINDTKGINLGDVCIIPSELQANEFCNGFNDGINDLFKLTDVNKNNYTMFKCIVTPIKHKVDLESDLLEKNPFIQQSIENHLITITKINKGGKLKQLTQFKTKPKEGKKENDICIVPSEELVKKRKKGYEKGINIFIKEYGLNFKNYNSNFIIKPNKTNKKTFFIFGIRRIFKID